MLCTRVDEQQINNTVRMIAIPSGAIFALASLGINMAPRHPSSELRRGEMR